MWHERKARLNAPIDFLKIGHHGSENATPWNDQEDGEVTEPSTILDAILPLPAGARHAESQGRRVDEAEELRDDSAIGASRRAGQARPERPQLPRRARCRGVEASEVHRVRKALAERFPQPWRTDCEHALSGEDFVDVEIEA